MRAPRCPSREGAHRPARGSWTASARQQAEAPRKAPGVGADVSPGIGPGTEPRALGAPYVTDRAEDDRSAGQAAEQAAPEGTRQAAGRVRLPRRHRGGDRRLRRDALPDVVVVRKPPGVRRPADRGSGGVLRACLLRRLRPAAVPAADRGAAAGAGSAVSPGGRPDRVRLHRGRRLCRARDGAVQHGQPGRRRRNRHHRAGVAVLRRGGAARDPPPGRSRPPALGGADLRPDLHRGHPPGGDAGRRCVAGHPGRNGRRRRSHPRLHRLSAAVLGHRPRHRRVLPGHPPPPPLRESAPPVCVAAPRGRRYGCRAGDDGMSLLTVGVSHRTAPVALLERCAMAAGDVVTALRDLVAGPHVREAIVLATCNRVEVFAEVARFHGGVIEVSRVLARQAGARVEELSPYVTMHYEDQAVAHLFTVASGLDSMVVGETQVLGQLRAAYALARDEGTVGRALHPVAQRALRVGKRVHTETGLDRAGASLVSVALDRAEDSIGSLSDRDVLVVGAGSMGALAATTPARRGAAVTGSSRTEASAQRLADSIGGRAADLGNLPAELAAADVLVTCTGATGLVGGTDGVATAMHGRGGQPLVVVDLALPRDVDPGVAALPGVHVVDLALLQGERAATPGRPTAGPVAADDIAAAHALVEAETALLRAERQAAAVAPTVSALRSQAAEVVDAELLRLSTRLPDLDARARAEIARTVRRVVDKLLHEPTVRVKELAASPGGTDYAGALRALFGLGFDVDVEGSSLADTLAEAVAVDPERGAQ